MDTSAPIPTQDSTVKLSANNYVQSILTNHLAKETNQNNELQKELEGYKGREWHCLLQETHDSEEIERSKTAMGMPRWTESPKQFTPSEISAWMGTLSGP